MSHEINMYFNPKKVRLFRKCVYGVQIYVRIGNYFSSSFLIEKGLKQGVALPALLLNIALEYVIRKVQETNLGLDMNGTH